MSYKFSEVNCIHILYLFYLRNYTKTIIRLRLSDYVCTPNSTGSFCTSPFIVYAQLTVLPVIISVVYSFVETPVNCDLLIANLIDVSTKMN